MSVTSVYARTAGNYVNVGTSCGGSSRDSGYAAGICATDHNRSDAGECSTLHGTKVPS